MKSQKLIIALGIIAIGIACSTRSVASQAANRPVAARKVAIKTDIKYPALARQYNIFGKVRIEAIVSSDGTIKKARDIGGSPVLVKAVLDELAQWKFETAPRETTEIIEIEFSRDSPVKDRILR